MSFEKHMKIRLHSLPPHSPVPFDLYVSVAGHFVHYLRAGDVIAGEKILKLEAKAPQSFYNLTTERAT